MHGPRGRGPGPASDGAAGDDLAIGKWGGKGQRRSGAWPGRRIGGQALLEQLREDGEQGVAEPDRRQGHRWQQEVSDEEVTEEEEEEEDDEGEEGSEGAEASAGDSEDMHGRRRSCLQCGSTSTPQWREGPLGECCGFGGAGGRVNRGRGGGSKAEGASARLGLARPHTSGFSPSLTLPLRPSAGPRTLCNACGVRLVRALKRYKRPCGTAVHVPAAAGAAASEPADKANGTPARTPAHAKAGKVRAFASRRRRSGAHPPAASHLL